jgi:hypothetical protein
MVCGEFGKLTLSPLAKQRSYPARTLISGGTGFGGRPPSVWRNLSAIGVAAIFSFGQNTSSLYMVRSSERLDKRMEFGHRRNEMFAVIAAVRRNGLTQSVTLKADE